MQHFHQRLAVAVYNADYRVLTYVNWQEAVRLLLRNSVYMI